MLQNPETKKKTKNHSMKVYRWVPASIEGAICGAFESLLIAQGRLISNAITL